ncbi:MAG: hypothetical protein ACYTBZ_09595, partial [Planctomycetota bacterium]|jgi:DNA-directed RNA polymerase subunit RPC12/RpoP
MTVGGGVFRFFYNLPTGGRYIGPNNSASVIMVALSYLPVLVIAFAVYGVLTHFFGHSHIDNDNETRCRRCGYILRGITEPRCPECGEKI